MTRVLVLFHSWTGNVHRLAEAVAEGAGEVSGCDVSLKQVPEITPTASLDASGVSEIRKAFAHLPEATVDELPEYDGIAFGTPTRFGNMSASMRSFLDQTGPFYMDGSLIGKAATVFCGTGSGGGRETTITSFWHTLAHQGMTIVPLGYRDPAIRDLSGAHGGSPYGASVLSRGDGERPIELEKAPARTQGRALAEVARALAAAKGR